MPSSDNPSKIIVSRGGLLTVEVTGFHGIYPYPNRDAEFAALTVKRLTDQRLVRVNVIFSGTFVAVNPGAFLVSNAVHGNDFRVSCAIAAIGDYLDTSGMPDVVGESHAPLEITFLSDRLEEWSKRERLGTAEILDDFRGMA